MILSPLLAVALLAAILFGLMKRTEREGRRIEKRKVVKYEEFVDLEHITENVELMVQPGGAVRGTVL